MVQGNGKASIGAIVFRVLSVIVLTVGLMPLPALAQSTSDDGSDTASASTLSAEDYAAIEQAEADGDCVPGQALVVYHASGAAKGSTGSLAIQSDDSPLEDAGFAISDTWDLSAADSVADENGAEADGALAVQSEDSGSTIASGSDVRVALVERDDMSVADLVSSLTSLDFVECAQPNYSIEPTDEELDISSAVDSAETEMSTTATTSDADSAISTDSVTSTAADSGLATESLPAGITNDIYSSMQWYLSGADTSICGSTAGIDATAAYSASESGAEDNVVAVLDGGVDYTNPDLADMMWTDPGDIGLGPFGSHGYNGASGAYDPMPETDSHGTHCAGIAAAEANNSIGTAGISGNGTHTKIMGLRYDDDTVGGFFSGITSCYEYLVKAKLAGVNVVVVSCSWGSSNGAAYIPVLDYEINQAGKAGVITCFAAGNEQRDAYNYHDSSMLESPYVIEISLSNESGSLAFWTTYQETGDDIAAPGTKILSTVPNNDVGAFNAFLTYQSGDYDATTNPNGRADKLSYYTDIASLLSDSTANLSIRLTDISSTTLSDDAQKALSWSADDGGGSMIPAGQDALRLTIDYDKLKAAGVSKSDAYIAVSWKISNPFLGKTDLDFNDYRFSLMVDENGYDVHQYAQTTQQIYDSQMNNLAADGNVVDTERDGFWTDKQNLTGLDTADDSLTVGARVHMDGASTGTQSCLVTGFGIGRATNPTTDSESAFMPYGYMNGTSMATPLTAGSFAKLASLYTDYSPLQIRGLICGGTTLLSTEEAQASVASGGRFTFANALDNNRVNANTWSVTTSGTSVTVHGFNLNRASLYVDKSTTAVTPTAQSADEITFTADSTLFDGKSHRFDVTDILTGRTYKSAYVMPDTVGADALAVVHDLPAAANTAIVSLISTSDRIFCADQYGSFLYSCADLDDSSSSWTECTAPKITWASKAGDNRVPMAYTYANGKIYAFACDNAEGNYKKAIVYSSIYDIATDTWSECSEIGEIDQYGMTGISACAVDGTVYCMAVEGDDFYSNDAAILYTCPSGSSTFTSSKLTIADSNNYPDTIHSVEGALLGFIEPAQKEDEEISYQASLASLDPAGSSWTSTGALTAYGSSEDYFLVRSLLTRVQISVGNGIVVAGQSVDGLTGATAGIGDLQLIGADASVTGLGSYGLTPSASGFSVGSMAMYDGKLYIEAIDLKPDSDSPEIYTIPATESAKLASTDATLTAATQTGGTAAVTDWRGSSAATSSLSVREGDTATWTATADAGYDFAGWYDAGGNLVSSDATYSTVTAADTTLTAHFDAYTYSVAFNANADDATGTMAAQDMTYGTAAPLSACTLARAGYNFTGWNTAADGSGTSYADGATVSNLTSIDGDTFTLYAQWDETVQTKTFDNGVVATLTGSPNEDIVNLIIVPRGSLSDLVASALGDRMVVGDWDVYFTDGRTDGFGTLTLAFPSSSGTAQIWEVHSGVLTKGSDQDAIAGKVYTSTTTLSEFTVTAAASPNADAGTTPASGTSAKASTLPKTGDSLLPLSLAVLSLVFGAGAMLVLVRRRARR